MDSTIIARHKSAVSSYNLCYGSLVCCSRLGAHRLNSTLLVPHRTDGNSWSSGPAPPSPPGTQSSHRKSGKHQSTSSQDSGSKSKKSGLSAGGIAGVVIAILVVGAIVGFFIFKRRSRRSAPEVEKLDINKPFVPAASNDVFGNAAFLYLV